MKHSRLLVLGTAAWFAGVMLVGQVGCRSIADRPADEVDPVVQVGLTDASPDQVWRPIIGMTEVEALAQRLGRPGAPPNNQRAFNTLALSGGGSYGAYSAGLLVGWTKAGTRPKFDVVTGVSTGAFVATLAFLGPERDAELHRFYTTINNLDIYRPKNIVRGLLTGALADTVPLERLIVSVVTPELLRAVAAEHNKGRRLYVGTTNLETRLPTVWDMGAIASRNTMDDDILFRKVLLASAAIPAFFPAVSLPVVVDGKTGEELHVDGGVTQSVFFQPPQVPRSEIATPEPLAGSNLYIIIAGKLYADPAVSSKSFADIAGGSIVSLLYAGTRADLFHLYSIATGTKMNYQLASIPQDFPNLGSATTFDRVAMSRLFDAGLQAASQPELWRSTPPGLNKAEYTVPRTGNHFTRALPTGDVIQTGGMMPSPKK